MSKEHVYSDLDMILASQIAYMDAGGSSRPNVTVGDMIDNARTASMTSRAGHGNHARVSRRNRSIS